MNTVKYSELPQNVLEIVYTLDENENLYQECQRIVYDLNAIGWDASYDLGATLFDFHKM